MTTLRRTTLTGILAICATLISARGQGYHWSYATRITQRYGQGSYAPAPESVPYPVYPLQLVRAAVTGEAALEFTVLADGQVRDIKVVSASQKEFADTCVAAVKSWKFLPLAKNGWGPNSPSQVRVNCSFQFELGFDD